MKKRDRHRQRAEQRRALVPPSRPERGAADGSARRLERLGWLVAGVLVVALTGTVVYRIWSSSGTEEPPAPIAKAKPLPPSDDDDPPEPDGMPHGHGKQAEAGDKGLTDSFLDAFNDKDGKSEQKSAEAAPSSASLETQFNALAEIGDELAALKKRVATPGAIAGKEALAQATADRDRLLEQFNEKSLALEKALARARQARPGDAIAHWLTGELLILVGGEPEEIMPYLQFAVSHGLNRPRLLASVARSQLEANRFATAYGSAVKCLTLAGQEQYPWDTYVRCALCAGRFDEVIDRLDRAFPARLPAWARSQRYTAVDLSARWKAEETLERAEAKADDLPRVRLVIEHRRFGRDAAGKSLTTVQSTDRSTVVVELFENEAPNTVANFIDLVSRRFYDGTSFHLALPATVVTGGDPNTRNSDPSDDGTGDPGYTIPDECLSPKARSHFRGSLSMVNTGPHTAGSQFFLCLAPAPQMNGHFTVFGRVIEGQDAVDAITPGRTTRMLGHYGKIIPGDLLVRAEVLRKRNHEYRVVKDQP
jgi:cyclophilin family peptidyl-prolyl cis-trans isomerase